MSRQDSWSCLTVEQFLRLNNWEGQAEAREQGRWGAGENFAFAHPLLSQTAWQCLTVQQFLHSCSWEGQKEVEEMGRLRAGEKSAPLHLCTSAPLPLSQTSWECLSVKEFFSLCNWQGQPQENHNWQHLDPYSRLKQQVSEFFQFVPWEGNPEIGTLPKSAATLTLPSVDDVEHTFADLSDLF